MNSLANAEIRRASPAGLRAMPRRRDLRRASPPWIIKKSAARVGHARRTLGSAGRALGQLVKLCDLEDLVLVVELIEPRFSPADVAALLLNARVSNVARVEQLTGFGKPLSLGEGLQFQAHLQELLLGRTWLVRLTFANHNLQSHIILQVRHSEILSSCTTGRTKHPPFSLSSINLNSNYLN